MRAVFMLGLLVLAGGPARADWVAANPAVAEAAKVPRIAAVLKATETMGRAILARDQAGFAAVFADDVVVNNPFNKIARKADAVTNMKTGLIDYSSLHRSIEYAAVRGAHDVVLMGEEHLTPVGAARFAGKDVQRRTTEVWTDASGQWKLAIRQATVFSAE